MNKREVVWLIVRMIGLYVGYLAVVTLFSLVSSIYAIITIGGDSTAGKPDSEITRSVTPGFPTPSQRELDTKTVKTDPVVEKAKSEAFKTILFYVFLTALYGGAAFYLLFKGGLFFNLLVREQTAASQARRRDEETVTTLKL